MSRNWIQHTLGERGWRPQRQAVALAALGLFIALIIGALYLSQVASEATTGRQLADLIAQRDELERTNEQLRAEIASLKSVPRLLARAKELGFVEADASSIEYLVVNGYNPNRSLIVPTPESPQQPQPVYDETFGGWLQQQWDNLRRQFDSFTKRGG
jgi:cell division protein FtsB